MLEGENQKRFIDLFSKIIGVSKKSLTDYLENNNVTNLLLRPQTYTLDPLVLKKISAFTELKGLAEVGMNVENTKMNSPQAVYDHLRKYADIKDKEHFIALYLDTKNKIIQTDVINVGNLGCSLVNIKDISKRAILCDAANVVVAHNHPSGDPTPSMEDRMITQRIDAALKMVDVKLLDHTIIGQNRYYSFKENDLMDNYKSLGEMLNAKESHVEYSSIKAQYKEVFKAVDHLTETSLAKLDELTRVTGSVLTPQDIKNAYIKTGKSFEVNPSPENAGAFNYYKDLTEDMTKANNLSKQQGINPSPIKQVELEL